MKINEFEELTNFISDEYLKMADTYNINRPSNEFIKFVEDVLEKYSKLYDKPLYKLEKYKVKIMFIIKKQELDLEKALATMPHGKIWKFFHKDLWKKMLYQNPDLEKSSKSKEDKKKTKSSSACTAVVVKSFSAPQYYEEEQ